MMEGDFKINSIFDDKVLFLWIVLGIDKEIS